MPTREDLYNRLLNETKVLTTEPLQNAFREIDRAEFMPEDYKVEAYEDYPVPIGYDQTISQPTTVAFMLELLDVHEGDRILDIGSGSGWTTALLSVLTGAKGSVMGIERIPELVMFSESNLASYKFEHTEIRIAKAELGIPGSTFDRILVSAETAEIPDTLIQQLAPKGTLVLVVNGSVVKVTKDITGKIEKKEFPGFAFVPLVHKE
jgi:protein-L-isoaspartate(D-aspartate) O-methyltransferase